MSLETSKISLQNHQHPQHTSPFIQDPLRQPHPRQIDHNPHQPLHSHPHQDQQNQALQGSMNTQNTYNTQTTHQNYQTQPQTTQQTHQTFYSHFVKSKDQKKQKIKEIISMSTKNLLDLTSCLLQIHSKLNEPQNSAVSSKFSQAIDDWHEELVSGAMATRRNINRLISDIKYLFGSVKGTDTLFMYIDELSQTISEGWSLELMPRTYNSLKAMIVDLVLINDPALSGRQQEFQEELPSVLRNVEELQGRSQSFVATLSPTQPPNPQNLETELKEPPLLSGREKSSMVSHEVSMSNFSLHSQFGPGTRATSRRNTFIHGEELTGPSKSEMSFIHDPSPLKSSRFHPLGLNSQPGTLTEDQKGSFAYGPQFASKDARGKESLFSKAKDLLILSPKISETTISMIESIQSEEYQTNDLIEDCEFKRMITSKGDFGILKESRELACVMISQDEASSFSTIKKHPIHSINLNKENINDGNLGVGEGAYGGVEGARKGPQMPSEFVSGISGKEAGVLNLSQQKFQNGKIKKLRANESSKGAAFNAQNSPKKAKSKKPPFEIPRIPLEKITERMKRKNNNSRISTNKGALGASMASLSPDLEVGTVVSGGNPLKHSSTISHPQEDLELQIVPGRESLASSSNEILSHSIAFTDQSLTLRQSQQRKQSPPLASDGLQESHLPQNQPQKAEIDGNEEDPFDKDLGLSESLTMQEALKAKQEAPKTAPKQPEAKRRMNSTQSNQSLPDHKKSFNFSNQTFNANSRASGLGSDCSLVKHRLSDFDTTKNSNIDFNQKEGKLYESCSSKGINEMDINELHRFEIERSNQLSTIQEKDSNNFNLSSDIPNTDSCVFKRRIARNSVSSKDSISPKVSRTNEKVENLISKSGGLTSPKESDRVFKSEMRDPVFQKPNHIFARSPIRSGEGWKEEGIGSMSVEKEGEALGASGVSGKKALFPIKEFMENRNSEVIHTNIENCYKVEMSPDGDYCFFGGNGLNVLQLSNGVYTMLRRDKDKRIRFNSIKVLENGRVIIVEPNTNNLKVYNRKFQRILKLKGIKGDSFQNEAIRCSRCIFEKDCFFWFRGGTVVSIVDTKKFKSKDIDMIKEGTLAISITVSESLDRVMVLSVDDRSFEIYLNYWEVGRKVHRKLSSICDKLKIAMSLEVSLDSRTVFVSGSDSSDFSQSRPVLSAVSFDEHMTEKTSIRLSDSSMGNVYKVRRMEGFDTVFASGEKLISIVNFDAEKGKFKELKQLRNIHSGSIYSFMIQGKDIFSVSSSDNYIHKF